MRIYFYLAKMYTEALRFGEEYSKLRKCIAIDIVDFILVKSEENHSLFSLRNKRGEEFTDLFEIHIVELSKRMQGDDPLGEWIRLFNADTEDELERVAASARIPEVKEVIEMVKTMNLTKSLRWIFEQQMKARRDRWAEDEYIKDLGKAEGKAEGKVEGKTEDVLRLLARSGAIPSDLLERIRQQRDPEILGEWLLVAADAKSVQEFRDRLEL